MKKLSSFNGGLTSYFTAEGYDSKMILDAVNAVVGSLTPDKSETKAKARESGRVTAKGEDKREVTVSESERRSVKVPRCPATALYAVSSDLDKIQERGTSVIVSGLETSIELWFRRSTWRLNKPAKPEEKPETEEKTEA